MTMGIIRTLFKTTVVGATATTGAFFVATRNSKFVPFDPADPILSSTPFKKYNPESNPTMKDICIKKVPLVLIKPELLEIDGKLAEAFCAGVWGGWGYAYQRSYLSKKYEGPLTAHQLWSPSALRSSAYDVGTQITDHFEVISKTPTAIVFRCGDSPLKTEVRPSDGLFEMIAKVNKQEGFVEFGLKSVFYQGLGKAQEPPVPWYIEFLHRQYTKLWMETAIQNVVR